MSKLRITLVKSPIGYESGQRGTVRALGLRRIRQTVEKEDTRDIRGMVHKVKHLLKLEEV